MSQIRFDGRRLAAALLLSLLFLAPLAMQSGDDDEPYVLIKPPSVSALATPTPQASSPLVTPTPSFPVAPTPSPSPTATPWECEAKEGEYAANAPKERKESAHSLGYPVDPMQPDRLLARAFHADLCGAPGHPANKSLAVSLYVEWYGGNPNRPWPQYTWAQVAKTIASMIQWDKITALPERDMEGTHYTVAAQPNLDRNSSPELYMTYFPHKRATLVYVPLILPNGQVDSWQLRPDCGWQFVMKEVEYEQWIGTTTMRTRLS